MAEAAAVPQHRFFCHCCKGEVNPKLPVSSPLRDARRRRFFPVRCRLDPQPACFGDRALVSVLPGPMAEAVPFYPADRSPVVFLHTEKQPSGRLAHITRFMRLFLYGRGLRLCARHRRPLRVSRCRADHDPRLIRKPFGTFPLPLRRSVLSLGRRFGVRVTELIPASGCGAAVLTNCQLVCDR